MEQTTEITKTPEMLSTLSAKDFKEIAPGKHQRAQAMLGNGKEQSVSYIFEKVGEKGVLGEGSYKITDTVYFKDCKDCEWTLNEVCTKLFFENCVNCKVTINQKVVTSVIDVWKCTNFQILCNTSIGSLIADVCKGVNIGYTKKEFLGTIVWTTVYDLVVNFHDTPEHNFVSGTAHMKEEYPELKEETDQFITRVIKDKVLSEKIIRLPNGFPTTVREKKEFDERQERNIQAFAKNAGITIGKKKTGPKVKPNEPCPCGSGKKYKKCCEGKDPEE